MSAKAPAHRVAEGRRGPRRWVLAACASVGVALGWARPCAAHGLDVAYLRIEARGAALSVVLDLDAGGAAHLLELDRAELGPGEVSRRADVLADATYRASAPTTELGPCRWRGPSAQLTGRTVRIMEQADCPPGARRLRWAFPFVDRPGVSPTFLMFTRARSARSEHLAVIDRAKAELEIELRAAAALGLGELVWMGLGAVGAAPDAWLGAGGLRLADGSAHILLLFALLLAGGTLSELAGITGGLVLGRAIALALATFAGLRLSSGVADLALALALIAAAAAACSARVRPHRWRIATGLGVVSGLALAGGLMDRDLGATSAPRALLGHALGVELGQLALGLVLVPLIALARWDHRRRPVRVLAAVVAVAGACWFVARALVL